MADLIIGRVNGASGYSGYSGPAGGPMGVSGYSGYSGHADRYITFSSTSFNVPAIGVSQTFTVQTNLAYSINEAVVVTATLNSSDFFVGIITAYNSNTGVATILCTETNFAGNSHALWSVNLTGPTGLSGYSGYSGYSTDLTGYIKFNQNGIVICPSGIVINSPNNTQWLLSVTDLGTMFLTSGTWI